MRPNLLAALLAVASTTASAQTPDGPTPRELHAAQCVAALEVEAEALARDVKSGDEAARPRLQSRIESGTAFVGDSYLNGLTDEHRARALASDALEAQKRLTDAQLAARQEACATEGRKLLDAGNPLQQAVVKRLARRRMEKLLQPST